MRREVLLRTWSDAPVRLELFNPGAVARRFVLRTPTGGVTDTLPPGARRAWEVPVPADVLAVVTIDFPKGTPPEVNPSFLMVQLVP